MNLAAVRIFVKDVAEAREFYAHRLGFEVVGDNVEHGVCILDAGSAQLIVESVRDQAPADEQALIGRFTGVSFAVEDIAKHHQTLKSLGVEFSGEPEQQYWGGWLATLKDPAGNELQLVQTAA
jgi:catechol 2,3-dioxygenase-like lactoylglutathione lyase family enzyme